MELYSRSVRSSNPTRPHVARRRSLAAMGRIVANAATVAAVLSFAVGRAPKARAPKGGLEVAGRFYRGGSFVPTEAALFHGGTEPVVFHGGTVEPPAQPNPRDAWPEWVDADRWTISGPAVEPLRHEEDESPTFEPTARDEAWNNGWLLGRSGVGTYDERFGRGCPEGYPSDVALQIEFRTGNRAGLAAHKVAYWRDVARSLGLAGYRDCEPPADLSSDEAAAYRAGHAAGVTEYDEERACEAWVDSCEREAMERECHISDRDVWPAGCMS
jgi:hypothetical protein